MTISLDDLIVTHWEALVDAITKEAICQIPSYGQAPLRLTIERVERWLKTLAESIAKNNPPILAGHLVAVAEERQEEGYPVGDLHAIVGITQRHLGDLIASAYADPVEREGHMALLAAAIESARMTLSVAYIHTVTTRELRRRG